jgi:hypothetical protein
MESFFYQDSAFPKVSEHRQEQSTEHEQRDDPAYVCFNPTHLCGFTISLSDCKLATIPRISRLESVAYFFAFFLLP